MVSVKTLPATSFKLVPKSGDAVELKNLDDFVTNNESQSESADIDAPIVFVGYGITAPEYRWDDYKGVDLKGKVALVFVNEPSSDDPKFFKGKALTYYGRWTYKFEETARRGAVATLIIHRTDLASYGWQVVRNSWGSEREYLKRDETPKVQAASWIQLDVAKKLAAMGGQDLDKLFAQAQTREFKPVELPVRFASACRQRTAAVHRAQRGRAVAGQRSEARWRSGAVHRALRSPGHRHCIEGRQHLQRRDRQRDRLRHLAGVGACLGRCLAGSAAIDSVCRGYRRRAGAARL